jgi:hypothetical protein
MMQIVTELRQLVSGSTELLIDHARLAQKEFSQDAGFYAKKLGIILACIPFILVGYGFLCAALAMLLQRFMAADFAFLIVGILNVLLGVIGMVLVSKTLKQKKFMQLSASQMDSTLSALAKRNSHE